jgi:hypothetical protein
LHGRFVFQNTYFDRIMVKCINVWLNGVMWGERGRMLVISPDGSIVVRCAI